MRGGELGMTYIKEVMTKLAKNHKIHMSVYGHDNQERLIGKYEKSSIDDLTWGVGDPNASIRIPS